MVISFIQWEDFTESSLRCWYDLFCNVQKIIIMSCLQFYARITSENRVTDRGFVSSLDKNVDIQVKFSVLLVSNWFWRLNLIFQLIKWINMYKTDLGTHTLIFTLDWMNRHTPTFQLILLIQRIEKNLMSLWQIMEQDYFNKHRWWWNQLEVLHSYLPSRATQVKLTVHSIKGESGNKLEQCKDHN